MSCKSSVSPCEGRLDLPSTSSGLPSAPPSATALTSLLRRSAFAVHGQNGRARGFTIYEKELFETFIPAGLSVVKVIASNPPLLSCE